MLVRSYRAGAGAAACWGIDIVFSWLVIRILLFRSFRCDISKACVCMISLKYAENIVMLLLTCYYSYAFVKSLLSIQYTVATLLLVLTKVARVLSLR